ncbi:MAG: hypothetical protein GX180_03530, partial [Enterococcus sp.]|nr:hypothetical protein [Enterococcus sp.]
MYLLVALLCKKVLQNTYKLNIRDFSSILGISYTNLSSIENGSLQPKYIDNLMRLAKDPYAFRNLMVSRKSNLTQDTYEKLIKLLDNLVLNSYREHEELAKKVSLYHLEMRNQFIMLSNTIDLNNSYFFYLPLNSLIYQWIREFSLFTHLVYKKSTP